MCILNANEDNSFKINTLPWKAYKKLWECRNVDFSVDCEDGSDDNINNEGPAIKQHS
jgi:hypothetical protein